MRQRWIARSSFVTPLILVGILGSTPGRSIAQPLPTCNPPRPDEYLLLVRNPNADTQNQLRQLLPSNAVLTDCRYDNNPVVRVEGFVSADIAGAWAQYLSTSSGLEAIVARPPAASSTATNFPSPTQTTPNSQITPNAGTSPATTQAANPATNPAAAPSNPAPAALPTTPAANATATATAPAPAPQTTAARPMPAFNPRPLGGGYAVVVNYFNRPEVALDVQQFTDGDVGLVAFEQRPYLLVAYTPDPAAASAVLRSLTERGFTASIVDSQRAILLTPAVAR
ncbi:hypothetical protein NDI45_01555 [Leptolyngbya sp. GB1-A1]|uniref:hypothetical protein n=1 Tax=Leptolyngbya sp. GB1-A1 TaxID=2933908 RepID=UPI003297659C